MLRSSSPQSTPEKCFPDNTGIPKLSTERRTSGWSMSSSPVLWQVVLSSHARSRNTVRLSCPLETTECSSVSWRFSGSSSHKRSSSAGCNRSPSERRMVLFSTSLYSFTRRRPIDQDSYGIDGRCRQHAAGMPLSSSELRWFHLRPSPPR